MLSCEGEVGPVGPPGEPGIPGDPLTGTVFEIEGSFTPENTYRLHTTYPSNVNVYDSDVVLVYILWEQVDGLDVWRLMPQTVDLPDGIIQYNFDYTREDVQVFMEFTVPEETLRPAETDNQVFRVAIVPSAFAENTKTDISTLDALLKSSEINLKNINELNISSTPQIK